jgi:hypothetical protein
MPEIHEPVPAEQLHRVTGAGIGAQIGSLFGADGAKWGGIADQFLGFLGPLMGGAAGGGAAGGGAASGGAASGGAAGGGAPSGGAPSGGGMPSFGSLFNLIGGIGGLFKGG